MNRYWTKAARDLLGNASKIARQCGQSEVGTRHLLIALCETKEDIIADVLKRSGLDTFLVIKEATINVDIRERLVGHVCYSHVVKEIMSVAERLKTLFGQSEVDAAHLMLSMLCNMEADGAVVLTQFGADIAAMRSMIREVIDPNFKP